MIAHQAPARYDQRAEDAWRAELADAITKLQQSVTGWTQWTGTASRATVNADAPPTNLQLGQALKAVLDDFVFKVKS